MFPAPFGHIKIKHHGKKWGSSSSSSSSSDGYGNPHKAFKKEQKRQRKLMKHMAKHGHGVYPGGAYAVPGQMTVVTRTTGPACYPPAGSYPAAVPQPYPTGCSVPMTTPYGAPGYPAPSYPAPSYPAAGYAPPPPYAPGTVPTCPPTGPSPYPVQQPAVYPPGTAYPPYPPGRPY